MVMSWIWTGIVFVSILCAFISGKGEALAAAALEGAQAGVTLAIAMSGAICLMLLISLVCYLRGVG
jgi:spore maturation protein A